MNHCVPLLLALLVFSRFDSIGQSPKEEPPVPADWRAWRAKRTESIIGTNGWITLVGLHWLQEGRNFAGTDPTNDVVFPPGRAAAGIGFFLRNARTVLFEAAPGVVATIAGKAVQSVQLQSDATAEPTRLQVGPLDLIVIQRGERVGLRVRDQEAPARVHFRGLDYFPYDPAWRIEGRFERFTKPRKLRVPDVTGETQEFVSPGEIVFAQAGTEHRLEVVEEPREEEYFVMFCDRTSSDSTYPAGRFLYVARPDARGRVVIDFNRAYNPPCAFTKFATCPLPPRQNRLPLAVKAGERKPADR